MSNTLVTFHMMRMWFTVNCYNECILAVANIKTGVVGTCVGKWVSFSIYHTRKQLSMVMNYWWEAWMHLADCVLLGLFDTPPPIEIKSWAFIPLTPRLLRMTDGQLSVAIRTPGPCEIIPSFTGNRLCMVLRALEHVLSTHSLSLSTQRGHRGCV